MVHNTPEQGLTRGLRHQPQELVPAELPRSKELEAQQRAGTAGTRAPSWGSHLSTSEGPQESSAGPRSNPQVLRGRRRGQSHIQAAKGFPGGPAHPTHRLPPPATDPSHAPPVPPAPPPCPRPPPQALWAPPRGPQPRLNRAAREQGGASWGASVLRVISLRVFISFPDAASLCKGTERVQSGLSVQRHVTSV